MNCRRGATDCFTRIAAKLPAVRRPSVVASVLGLALGCRRAENAAVAPPPTPVPTPPPAIAFAEKAAALGIDFTHVNGASGRKWMPETMGGGVAVLDSDSDGRPGPPLRLRALALAGGSRARRPPKNPRSRSIATRATTPPDFRASGNATREAGLERVLYGMGASVGDYDSDGRDDVYVTALNRNFLFHNLGGRFEEVASKAGVRESGWGTSSAWLDYDGDGRLDLYVCRYIDWTPEKDLFCTLDGKTKAYCTPERYPGVPSHLYKNAGGGRFIDVTTASGTGHPNQKALGVAPWDFDGDGRVDLLVANDTAPLFRPSVGCVRPRGLNAKSWPASGSRRRSRRLLRIDVRSVHSRPGGGIASPILGWP